MYTINDEAGYLLNPDRWTRRRASEVIKGLVAAQCRPVPTQTAEMVTDMHRLLFGDAEALPGPQTARWLAVRREFFRAAMARPDWGDILATSRYSTLGAALACVSMVRAWEDYIDTLESKPERYGLDNPGDLKQQEDAPPQDGAGAGGDGASDDVNEPDGPGAPDEQDQPDQPDQPGDQGQGQSGSRQGKGSATWQAPPVDPMTPTELMRAALAASASLNSEAWMHPASMLKDTAMIGESLGVDALPMAQAMSIADAILTCDHVAKDAVAVATSMVKRARATVMEEVTEDMEATLALTGVGERQIGMPPALFAHPAGARLARLRACQNQLARLALRGAEMHGLRSPIVVTIDESGSMLRCERRGMAMGITLALAQVARQHGRHLVLVGFSSADEYRIHVARAGDPQAQAKALSWVTHHLSGGTSYKTIVCVSLQHALQELGSIQDAEHFIITDGEGDVDAEDPGAAIREYRALAEENGVTTIGLFVACTVTEEMRRICDHTLKERELRQSSEGAQYLVTHATRTAMRGKQQEAEHV